MSPSMFISIPRCSKTLCSSLEDVDEMQVTVQHEEPSLEEQDLDDLDFEALHVGEEEVAEG